MAIKIDKNLTGTQQTDELHNSVGAGFYSLTHDTFFGGADFDIYTLPASGGTHLIEDTHYTLHDEDSDLSTEAGITVYTTLKVVDPTYQACDLYFTYKTVGDYNEAVDVNILGDLLPQTAAYVIKDLDRNPIIPVTTGAVDMTVTLPTLADNQGKFALISKDDAGVGILTVDGEGAELIGTVATFALPSQGDYIYLIGTANRWQIISFKAHADSGWLLNEEGGAGVGDWTNVHLGNDPTDPTDNFTHNLGVPLSDLSIRLLISTDGTDANSFEHPIIDTSTGVTFNRGIKIFAIDNNNVKIQTADGGLRDMADNGTVSTIDAQDYSYKIIAKRII